MITDPHSAGILHYIFEWLALFTGLLIFRIQRRRKGLPPLTSEQMFPALAGCLLGAALGNKLAFWIDNPQLWPPEKGLIGLLVTGQSIVGALLGGWLGVEAGKRISGTKDRTGDDYVIPVLAGITVGRIGCFLAGLNDGTAGIPTHVPWAVDFGDGITRHPTQLYELAAAILAAVAWPTWRRPFAHISGLGFRVMLLGYLLWRIFVDMLKPVPFPYPLGLSGLQWLCIVSAFVTAAEIIRLHRRHVPAPAANMERLR